MIYDEQRAREFLVKAEGPKAAAWLVKEHKHILHRHGSVEFTIVKGASMPVWFSYAIETLSESKRWSVHYEERAALKVWTVQWKGWCRNVRPC